MASDSHQSSSSSSRHALSRNGSSGSDAAEKIAKWKQKQKFQTQTGHVCSGLVCDFFIVNNIYVWYFPPLESSFNNPALSCFFCVLLTETAARRPGRNTSVVGNARMTTQIRFAQSAGCETSVVCFLGTSFQQVVGGNMAYCEEEEEEEQHPDEFTG